MDATATITEFEAALRREGSVYDVDLGEEAIARLSQYFALVQHWNPRLHLVAPCSAEEFATRHVLESLIALPYLIEGAKIVDIGSGGGLPIIPCLIARSDLSATLIEASAKKAVFLRETITRLELNADVRTDRFELTSAPEAGFVTCRALERFAEMLPEMIEWAPEGSTLLFFGGEAIESQLGDLDRQYRTARMPNSEGRYLFVVDPQPSPSGAEYL